MRYTPWILAGLFAIATSCGGGNGAAPASTSTELLPDGGNRADQEDDVAGDDDALTCDAGDDASPCMVCFHGECCAQISRCEQDARCSALMVCRSACKADDKACRNACEAEHPLGVATLQAAEQCALNACKSACAP